MLKLVGYFIFLRIMLWICGYCKIHKVYNLVNPDKDTYYSYPRAVDG